MTHPRPLSRLLARVLGPIARSTRLCRDQDWDLVNLDHRAPDWVGARTDAGRATTYGTLPEQYYLSKQLQIDAQQR